MIHLLQRDHIPTTDLTEMSDSREAIQLRQEGIKNPPKYTHILQRKPKKYQIKIQGA